VKIDEINVAKIRVVVSSASQPYLFAKTAVSAAVGIADSSTTILCHKESKLRGSI